MRKQLIVGATAVLAAVLGTAYYGFQTVKDITQLLKENQELKASIARLTSEQEIGIAQVTAQERGADGQLRTTVRFVELPLNAGRIDTEYTFSGDVLYFEALVVKFEEPLVARGEERALYVWRRLYAEKVAPADGKILQPERTEPARYEATFAKLKLAERTTFWNAIWDLAHDTQRLRSLGVRAISGKAPSYQMRPGYRYYLKISATGELNIEPEADPLAAKPAVPTPTPGK
ncbi:MAG: hypothetical protein JSR82_17790 [Verrucomicrobia bacterium]|nr:hypothetical protein [Verrucomicrobiota bacterium]